jgi:two-component system response regulator GlrR
VILAAGNQITANDLDLPDGRREDESESFHIAKARCVEAFEREYLSKMLVAHKGNISHAAKAAHKDRRAFWELLRKHHINPAAFKTANVLDQMRE